MASLCSCKSYNWNIGTIPEVVLPRPSWMPDGQRQNGVPVDACIADTVSALWKAGIVTRGSCCGHNLQSPSIILEEGRIDYDRVRYIIAETDDRKWDLLQWQLVNVETREPLMKQ